MREQFVLAEHFWWHETLFPIHGEEQSMKIEFVPTIVVGERAFVEDLRRAKAEQFDVLW